MQKICVRKTSVNRIMIIPNDECWVLTKHCANFVNLAEVLSWSHVACLGDLLHPLTHLLPADLACWLAMHPLRRAWKAKLPASHASLLLCLTDLKAVVSAWRPRKWDMRRWICKQGEGWVGRERVRRARKESVGRMRNGRLGREMDRLEKWVVKSMDGWVTI